MSEKAILLEVARQALALSKADQTEVLVSTSESFLTRFANNTIHQNVGVAGRTVQVRAVLGRRVDELPAKIRDDNPNLDAKKTFATVVYRLVDGKAVVTPVKVGPSDATHTVVESGLTEADAVIVGPYKVLEKLKHDQKVKDEKASATTKPAASQPAASAPAATRPATAT